MTATIAEFTLPAELEAHAPPEARGLPRDGVRMLVSRAADATVAHHHFTDLPGLLLPGDLVVVNNSRTLPAAVPARRQLAGGAADPGREIQPPARR
jgi:S-adenosylmethionine:tRNA ribosyltransferase-isomerase